MTQGVIAPEFEAFGARALGWQEHRFRGNAGTVWDTAPSSTNGVDGKMLTVMICGHADKIRMQVRSISDDGKIWIQSDSFLPLTLLGNQVVLFSEDGASPGHYRRLPATVEALGAIHFAPAEARSGKKGIAPEELYLEVRLRVRVGVSAASVPHLRAYTSAFQTPAFTSLPSHLYQMGLHGSKRKEQLVQLGVRPGDTVLLDRPISRCVGGDTFSGAYLDNGLGCFVATEVARKVARSAALTDHVRCLFAFASHEEIGRFGSRVMVQEMRPDVLIAVDVNHDYDTAPDKGKQQYQPLKLGDGMTMCVGASASACHSHPHATRRPRASLSTHPCCVPSPHSTPSALGIAHALQPPLNFCSLSQLTGCMPSPPLQLCSRLRAAQRPAGSRGQDCRRDGAARCAGQGHRHGCHGRCAGERRLRRNECRLSHPQHAHGFGAGACRRRVGLRRCAACLVGERRSRTAQRYGF